MIKVNIFFFKQKTAYEMRISDWSSDVCSSDLVNSFTHDSDVETFVALSAWIDNWRWAGVPFRLVTGKRMPSRTTEVVVSFKPVSHWIYERPDRRRARSEERRVGNACVSPCRSRCSPLH